MVEKNTNEFEENHEVSDNNIFKELSGDLDFGKIESDEKELKVKDLYYYLAIFAKFFNLANILLIIVTILLSVYVFIQKSDNFYSVGFLEPVCGVLIPSDVEKTGDFCSSAKSLEVDYKNKIEQSKKYVGKNLTPIVYDIYTLNNFINTTEIKFLLNKSQDKLNVLGILNNFDILKNDFTGNDKQMVTCENIKIDSDNILTADCSSYSSDWDGASKAIPGFMGDRLNSIQGGTSISIAASFLNYIDKNPKYNFKIIDKQRDFDAQPYTSDTNPYITKKTDFQIKLKYNNLNSNLAL